MLEKDNLQRKLQYLQTFGGVVPSEVLGNSAQGGFFTDQRAAVRQGLGDAQLKQQIQKLNVSSICWTGIITFCDIDLTIRSSLTSA